MKLSLLALYDAKFNVKYNAFLGLLRPKDQSFRSDEYVSALEAYRCHLEESQRISIRMYEQISPRVLDGAFPGSARHRMDP